MELNNNIPFISVSLSVSEFSGFETKLFLPIFGVILKWF